MTATCTPDRRRLARARSGFSLLGALVGLVVLAVAVPAGIYFLKPDLFRASEEVSVLTDKVKLANFTYDVTERGEIESSSNVEVRCEVQSRGAGVGGGTAIIQIIPEGTVVQPGDFLVKLDDSALQNERTQQQIVANTSQSVVIQSEAALKTAQIARDEYLNGTFKQEQETIESEVFVAEENLRRAEEYARYSERLSARGYVTPVQLEADRFAVKKAGADLALAKTKLFVLRNFTKAKMLNQFDADIKVAEAKLKADQESLALDQNKLALIDDQIKKCTIHAPAPGQVVYANENGGRGGTDIIIQEGTVVRERQVVIRLPDPTKMQVKGKINESRVDFVREGLPVKIRLDALPGVALDGTVTRVNDYPIASGGWFGNQAKEYATIINVLDPPRAMRPGMTAEVSIRVAQMENVLQLPVQAVFERGGKQYCLILTASGFEPREVKIGSSNDKFVVLKEGLKQDDEVVSNPRKYLNQVDLPASTAVEPSEMLANMPPPASEKDDPRAALAAAKPSAADGKPQEVVASAAGDEGKQRRRRGGSGGPGGGDPAAMAGMMIQRMDKNSDGKLETSELSELPEQMRAGFTTGDTNSDGFIDAGELAAAMRKFRAMGGAGGGRPPQNAGGGGAGP